MGSLIKIWKTLPMPAGAKIGRNGDVACQREKEDRQDVLYSRTSPVQSDTWTTQFTDEHGKMQRISTKTAVRSIINGYLMAIKSFAQYLTDIELLPKHPLKSVRKLNDDIDRRMARLPCLSLLC